MFWNRSNKSPITEEDELWLEEDLKWLILTFGAVHSRSMKTQLPTREFFDYTFTGTEQDAHFVLSNVCETMHVDENKIKLLFIEEESREVGGFLITPSKSVDGSWKGVAGLYSENPYGKTEIHINKSQLADPQLLIATMSHELSHEKLLGENRLDENDEYLTDLCAIFFGYGIFLGNSKFRIKNYNTPNGSGWKSSSQGYLPEQIISYAMALLQYFREEDDSQWKKYMKKGIWKFYEQSLRYMYENADARIFK